MKTSSPLTKQAYFASLIAAEFGDGERVQQYRNLCKKHGLTVVLRAFGEARSVPARQIKKSRLALFHYLVNQYALQRKQNTRLKPRDA
jgi:tartrate dehydratase beta subunit/fumarate hydratase class I family protein